MCLRSPWSSMGVTSTKVPVRGGRTGSGRRCFWQSLREILSLCQFPSWSLTNPLPLLLRAVLSVLPLPLPSWHKQRRCWNTCKDLCHQWDYLAQEAGKAEKEWEKMCKQVQDLRSVVRGELHLEYQSGLLGCQWVLQLSQVHPKRKRKRNKKDTLACSHKKGTSTISHT